MSNSVCPPQRSHRGPIANAFFYLLLHVNRNTLLHLICYAKPEWPNEDDDHDDDDKYTRSTTNHGGDGRGWRCRLVLGSGTIVGGIGPSIAAPGQYSWEFADSVGLSSPYDRMCSILVQVSFSHGRT